MLGGGGERAGAVVQAVKQVQLPARAGQELGRDPNRFARPHLVQVAEVGLHGEVAPAPGDVVGVGADQLHGAVGGLREQFQVVGFVHVAVVVGPALRDLPGHGDRERAGAGLRLPQAAFMERNRGAGAVVVLLQGAQDGNQIVVSFALQLRNVVGTGLAVGLARDPFDQVRGQLGYVGQP